MAAASVAGGYGGYAEVVAGVWGVFEIELVVGVEGMVDVAVVSGGGGAEVEVGVLVILSQIEKLGMRE